MQAFLPSVGQLMRRVPRLEPLSLQPASIDQPGPQAKVCSSEVASDASFGAYLPTVRTTTDRRRGTSAFYYREAELVGSWGNWRRKTTDANPPSRDQTQSLSRFRYVSRTPNRQLRIARQERSAGPRASTTVDSSRQSSPNRPVCPSPSLCRRLRTACRRRGRIAYRHPRGEWR